MDKSHQSHFIAAGGGAAILLITAYTLSSSVAPTWIQAFLLIFGGTLIAVPFIAKLTVGKNGFTFETVAPELSNTLQSHDKSIVTFDETIKDINETLRKLAQSVEELKHNELKITANGSDEKALTFSFDVGAIMEGISGVASKLASNTDVVQMGTESVYKIKGLIEALSEADQAKPDQE